MFHVPVGATFSDVAKGEPVALIDSSGWLTIAVNTDSAAERYGVQPGTTAHLRAIDDLRYRSSRSPTGGCRAMSDPFGSVASDSEETRRGREMKKQYVTDLAEGARVDAAFALRAKEVREARTGDAYLALDLADRTGVIPGASSSAPARTRWRCRSVQS